MAVNKYRPLDSSGNDYAGMKGMSGIDRAALTAAQQSWQAAQAAGDRAGMDTAHRQAEAIRRQYQYSGGADGSQYLPMPDYSAPAAPSYTDRYDDRKQALLDTILNRKQFSYDVEKDPLYEQYAAKYTREGTQAMEDTLAKVSARTGGLASSYAGQAAQQTYNGYMAALADKVPELEQMAYNRYLQDNQQQVDRLGLLRTAEQDDYGKYLDRLGQFNTDRSFGYGAYRDQVADERYSDETEYGRAQERAKLLAAVGDYSGYRALGLTDDEIARLEQAAQPRRGGWSPVGEYPVGNDLPEVDDPENPDGNGEKSFDSRMRGLEIILSEESTAAAEKNLEKFVSENWDYLTPGQQQQVKELAWRYGFSA